MVSICEPLLFPGTEFMFAAALEVGGADALKIWGRQWVKLLAVLYDGVTVALPGSTPEKKSLVGGGTPEGTAARTRVQLEIERIMGTVTS